MQATKQGCLFSGTACHEDNTGVFLMHMLLKMALTEGKQEAPLLCSRLEGLSGKKVRLHIMLLDARGNFLHSVAKRKS